MASAQPNPLLHPAGPMRPVAASATRTSPVIRRQRSRALITGLAVAAVSYHAAMMAPPALAQGPGGGGTPAGKAPAAQAGKSDQPLVSPRPGSTVKAQYGDWRHECTKPPGARAELCAITQDVTDETNADVGLSVHVQKLPSGESLLRVVAPLGVLLTHNLAVRVDGDYLGEAPFLRCYVLGCQAQIEIDDKLRAKLTGGKTLLLVIHRTAEQGVGIPISLNGFPQAFAALK
jgi:invasion protein IalB